MSRFLNSIAYSAPRDLPVELLSQRSCAARYLPASRCNIFRVRMAHFIVGAGNTIFLTEIAEMAGQSIMENDAAAERHPFCL